MQCTNHKFFRINATEIKIEELTYVLMHSISKRLFAPDNHQLNNKPDKTGAKNTRGKVKPLNGKQTDNNMAKKYVLKMKNKKTAGRKKN